MRIKTSLHSPSHEQDPRRFNALMSQVLGAAPLMPNKLMSRAIYLPTQAETPTTPRRGPHFPCDICPQYRIISTLSAQFAGVAYPGVRDNRSTINTKTGYDE